MLPYFLRAEDNSRGASAYHGVAGPLSVSRPQAQVAADAGLRGRVPGVRAARERGLQRTGAGRHRVLPGHAARRAPVVGRGCLPASRGLPGPTSPCTRMRWSPASSWMADGPPVFVIFAGVWKRWRGPRREVILSAGTIGSPHLLLLSGIGPAEQLIEQGIRVVADSPGVGANLSDHPVVTAMWHTPRATGLWEQAGPGPSWAAGGTCIRARSRPTSPRRADSPGPCRSLPAPDLQWHVLPVPFQRQGLADPSIRAISMLVTLVAVASRGVVRLRSDDPRHKRLSTRATSTPTRTWNRC